MVGDDSRRLSSSSLAVLVSGTIAEQEVCKSHLPDCKASEVVGGARGFGRSCVAPATMLRVEGRVRRLVFLVQGETGRAKLREGGFTFTEGSRCLPT